MWKLGHQYFKIGLIVAIFGCTLGRKEQRDDNSFDSSNDEAANVKFLDLSDKPLKDLSQLRNYQNLLYLNLLGSPNLNLGPLNNLENLLVLNADSSVACPKDWKSVALQDFCSSSRKRLMSSDYQLKKDIKAQKELGDILPQGYEFVFKYWGDYSPKNPSSLIGSSGSAEVYLVKESSSQSLFAAKFQKSRKGIDPDDNEKDIRVWKEKFDNPLEIFNFENCTLKTYIEGPTLAEAFTTLQFFDGSSRSKIMQSQFKNLYEKMWSNSIVVGDPSPMNHVFSDKLKKWVIVDGRSIEKFNSKGEARIAGRKKLRHLMGNVVFDYWQKPRLRRQIREGKQTYSVESAKMMDAYVEKKVKEFFASDLSP